PANKMAEDIVIEENDDGSIEPQAMDNFSWAFPGSSKFGKKGGERIKKKVECSKGMHAELMEFVRAGKIEENVPKVGTIQNWIGKYSCRFNHEETFIALQNFNTEDSSN
ncbi:5634_t:CDS:2, partial [Gigaspora margarita]